MEGYWKSESLKFYGANGVTYGWDNTLERYQKLTLQKTIQAN